MFEKAECKTLQKFFQKNVKALTDFLKLIKEEHKKYFTDSNFIHRKIIKIKSFGNLKY